MAYLKVYLVPDYDEISVYLLCVVKKDDNKNNLVYVLKDETTVDVISKFTKWFKYYYLKKYKVRIPLKIYAKYFGDGVKALIQKNLKYFSLESLPDNYYTRNYKKVYEKFYRRRRG